MLESKNIFTEIRDSILKYKKTNEDNLFMESTSSQNLNSDLLKKDFSKNSLESSNLKKRLREYFKKEQKYSEEIGVHPDFSHLIENKMEKHHIVSVFVDIKGSTKLATVKGLELEEIREIKNRILTTVISIFQVFDGHIHRLQGDAVFAFFGRKNKSKEDAIIDSLNAASILQYIFKNYVSLGFVENGWPTISIRTGIDFGNTDDVLWSNYGIAGCNEITTTSIYTDLAAKLQHKANTNSIMIGDNVKEFLDLPSEFYKVKKYTENGVTKEEKYILEHREFKYRMWEFNWEEYIGTFPRLKNLISDKKVIENKLCYTPEVDFKVSCKYQSEGSIEWHDYERNSKSIPKNSKLEFYLEFLDSNLKYMCDKINWEVNNRGKEAERAENLNFTSPNRSENKFICDQKTAYKGHHYMKVILEQKGKIIGKDKFGIYIE